MILGKEEFHFLVHCPKYSIPKEKFFNQIQHNFGKLNELSCTELIIKLKNLQNFSLNSPDTCLRLKFLNRQDRLRLRDYSTLAACIVLLSDSHYSYR